MKLNIKTVGLLGLSAAMCLALAGCSSSTTTSSEAESSDIVSSSESSISSSSEALGTVTTDMYDQIAVGMTYTDVAEVLGMEGMLTSSDEGTATDVYTWTPNDGTVTITVTFVDGAVTEKTEDGLTN